MRLQFTLAFARAMTLISLVLLPISAQVPPVGMQLERRYRLTQFDGTEFVVGSVLIVLKDGLVGGPALVPVSPTATYKNGQLHSPAGYDREAGSQATQAFAKGAKVYVHQIDVDVRGNSIEFFLVSGYTASSSISKNYYKSALKFEFPKGYLKTPIVPDIEEAIDSVFKIDPPSDEAEGPVSPSSRPFDPRPVLNNEDILNLVQEKVSDAVVIKKINSSRCDFDTSPGQLARLKQSGVSDNLLQAMLDASNHQPMGPGGLPPLGFMGNPEVQGTVEEYSALLEKSPNSALLYEQRAQAYLDEGQVGKAIADYTQAIQIDRKKWDSYIGRGRLFLRIGDLKSAFEDFTRAINLAPNPSLAYQMRAMTLGRENDIQGELDDLDRAIQADPQNRAAYFARERVLQGRGRSSRSAGDRLQEFPPKDGTTGTPPARARKPATELPREIYTIDKDMTAPVGLATPNAPYTPQARNDGVHGAVKLEIIVDAQGSVVDAKEISPELGYSLDESALHTVHTWKFKPATKNGVPIAVRMVVEFTFGPS